MYVGEVWVISAQCAGLGLHTDGAERREEMGRTHTRTHARTHTRTYVQDESFVFVLNVPYVMWWDNLNAL